MHLKEIPASKIWKYAQPELERRFLLKSKPVFIENSSFKEIRDKYLLQTHMRVRQTFDGQTFIYKLTKKLPLVSSRKDKQWISAIYLSKMEYDLFVGLPGHTIEKKRYYHPHETGDLMGIDEIICDKNTLWIAELEFTNEEKMKRYEFPFAYEKEITNEEGYSGYELSKRSN